MLKILNKSILILVDFISIIKASKIDILFDKIFYIYYQIWLKNMRWEA